MSAVQLTASGGAVRRHDAEVRTGAAVVLEVDGNVTAAQRTLARLDPGHATSAATMTVVALTRRTDGRALRGMFVEPAGFAAVAYGTDRTTDPATWGRLSAPAVDPVTFTGDSLTVQIGGHGQLGQTEQAPVTDLEDPVTRTGRRAELAVEYLSADGTRRSSTLGSAQLAASNGERLRGAVLCRDGCRLLQVIGRPDGPMVGALPLSALTVEQDGRTEPVDLGPADRWQRLPSSNLDDQLTFRQAGGGLVFDVWSNGAAFGVQHAWVPLALPVLVAEDARIETAPTLAAPDGSPLAIEPVARSLDAVPGSRQAVAVGDLEAVLRAGHARVTSPTTVQIWVSAAGAGRLDQLRQALTEDGSTVTSTRTAADAAAATRGTASALSAQIGPGLASLAGIFAGLAVALTMSAQRPVLSRDLAALRLAGVADGTVRRAAAVTYLRPGLAAVLAGAVAGTLGCVLVVTGLPMLADPLPAIHADLRLRLPALAGSVALAAGVLTGVVLLGIRRLDRGSGPDRLGGQP